MSQITDTRYVNLSADECYCVLAAFKNHRVLTPLERNIVRRIDRVHGGNEVIKQMVREIHADGLM